MWRKKFHHEKTIVDGHISNRLNQIFLMSWFFGSASQGTVFSSFLWRFHWKQNYGWQTQRNGYRRPPGYFHVHYGHIPIDSNGFYSSERSFGTASQGFPESLLVTQSGSPICRVITMFSQLQTDFASLQRLTSTSRDLKLDDKKDRIEKYFEMVERETLNWMNVVLRRWRVEYPSQQNHTVTQRVEVMN